MNGADIMQAMPAMGIPARKFAENATIRQELVQMDILPNTAVSAPAAIQEATAGTMLATDILEMLYAENVPLKRVLAGINVGLIVKILKICLKDLAIQVKDVQQIVGIMNITHLHG